MVGGAALSEPFTAAMKVCGAAADVAPLDTEDDGGVST